VPTVFEIWIHQRVLGRMTAEADTLFPLETGGVLVGYRVGSAQVIVDMIGAGPAATHKSYSFHADHEWECDRLDLIYKQSAGIYVYLGEWHTHPSGTPRMSRTDRATLARIAQTTRANAPNPLMMIGAGRAGKWEWLAHVYCTKRIFGLFARVEIGLLKVFDAPQTMSR
jgi:integrative and conjugative element protein (TIGR02256 family)